MPDAVLSHRSLQKIPERLRAAVDACARGDLAPNVALMRLIIEAQSASEIDEALLVSRATGDPQSTDPLAEISALWRRSAGAWATIKSVLAQTDHAPSNPASHAPAYWAALFDRLADSSPEAGVALYSLGSPALLERATRSLANCLLRWELLGRDRTVLDLGCGIGRVSAAIASSVRAVIGIDVSARMLAAARRRCAEHRNVLLVQTSGRDLAAFADGAFDLVLAVDTFPYLVLTGGGLVDTHLREVHRVLRPGGSLVAFNYAYDTDEDLASEAFRQHAINARLEPVRIGTRDLAWWDGITYHARRAA